MGISRVFSGCVGAPYQDHVKQDWILGLGDLPSSFSVGLGALRMQSAGPEAWHVFFRWIPRIFKTWGSNENALLVVHLSMPMKLTNTMRNISTTKQSKGSLPKHSMRFRKSQIMDGLGFA